MERLTISFRHIQDTFNCFSDIELEFSQPFDNVFEFQGDEDLWEAEEALQEWGVPKQEWTTE